MDNTDLNLRMISKISELDDAQPQLVDKVFSFVVMLDLCTNCSGSISIL